MVADDLPGNVDNLREVDVPVLSDTIAEAVYGGLDFETKVDQTGLHSQARQQYLFHDLLIICLDLHRLK